ncbi:MAG: hypothetical protein ACFE9D_01930 [Promethearchaeota archaeon]
MASKDVGQEQQLDYVPTDGKEGVRYSWVYETLQGQDVEIQVVSSGYGRFTIDTPWYRAQVRTLDLLDTVVHFCLTMYGAGKLILVL